MNERPTPDQIAATLWAEVRNDPDLDLASLLFTFLVRLDEHGYVIVHEDDVRRRLVANLLDGDEEGLLCVSVEDLLEAVVDALGGSHE